MGERGKAPRPTALKNLRPRSHHKKSGVIEPRLSVSMPPMPRWLDGVGKWAFNEIGTQLVKMRVVTTADKKALELLADTYSEYRRARAAILEKGSTYTSKNIKTGIEKRYVRPEVNIAKGARADIIRLLKQFGLTPAARTRVSMVEPEEIDPFEEYLKKGGIRGNNPCE